MSTREHLLRRSLRRSVRVGELVVVLARRELRLRYRQSVLDMAWAVIAPVVTLAVYGYVLSVGFDVRASCGPYAASAWTGMVLWTFVATAVGAATTSLVSAGDLAKKVRFPLEAVPLSSAAAALADLGVGLVTVVAVVLVAGIGLGLTWLGALLPIAMLVVWVSALSVAVGVLSVFLRDLAHATQLALRVGFFATPVVYEAQLLPPAFAWSVTWNPVGVAITDVRDAVLCGAWPAPGRSLLLLGVGAVVLVAALAGARALQTRIVDAL